ncbi:hypothetical protein [Jeotgalibaca porci]|uniref:hypothetical protein n=1 Tax=Jeotgalibaca porci TaxID=1868793 RepID=UPI0035A1809A
MTKFNIKALDRLDLEDEGSIKQAIYFVEETKNMVVSFNIPDVPNKATLIAMQNKIQKIVDAGNALDDFTEESIVEILKECEKFIIEMIRTVKAMKKAVKRKMTKSVNKKVFLIELKEIDNIEKDLQAYLDFNF